jgi:signal transduction histidine kinase
MAFADPQKPRPELVAVGQIIEEAAQLTALKANSDQLDIDIESGRSDKQVFVDSAQIATAIANILCNCLESYDSQTGPIKIAVDQGSSSDFVKITVTDFGCGMDAETLRKVTQPFFSAKPAGRKRGMGLAHAQRLIQINKGSLHISSQPGSGTTVTVLLPVLVRG